MGKLLVVAPNVLLFLEFFFKLPEKSASFASGHKDVIRANDNHFWFHVKVCKRMSKHERILLVSLSAKVSKGL